MIASDECYSEIYFDEATPPLGGLRSGAAAGPDGFARLVIVLEPVQALERAGHASGFVAGDAAILKKFLLYRTYHGGAMSRRVQTRQHRRVERRSARAREPRAVPRKSSPPSRRMLAEVLDVRLPDAALLPLGRRPRTGLHDTEFAARLYADYNVTVLPGSYLARDAHGINPGDAVTCAWRSSPTSTNASRPRSASSNSAARSR